MAAGRPKKDPAPPSKEDELVAGLKALFSAEPGTHPEQFDWSMVRRWEKENHPHENLKLMHLIGQIASGDK